MLRAPSASVSGGFEHGDVLRRDPHPLGRSLPPLSYGRRAPNLTPFEPAGSEIQVPSTPSAPLSTTQMCRPAITM